MNFISKLALASLLIGFGVPSLVSVHAGAQSAPQVAAAPLPDIGERKTITEADCTAAKLGTAIPAGAIGEPVSSVTPERAEVDGRDRHVAGLLHGRRLDGSNRSRGETDQLSRRLSRVMDAARGAARWRRDERHDSRPHRRSWWIGRPGSGHRHLRQRLGPRDQGCARVDARRRGDQEPRLHADEEDARCRDGAHRADVRRASPRFNYYIGTSQGGREALTVAQRYPDDYDGIIANVPIVNFSSLMLAPELIRIQEKPLANWVTPRQGQRHPRRVHAPVRPLDGLADGIINNYMACRAIFDVKQGSRGPAALGLEALPEQRRSRSGRHDGSRLPHRRADLDARSSSTAATRSPRRSPTACRTFGMWLPNTDPSGSGLISDARFKGQEGARRGCADAFASRRARRHRIPDAQPGRQPARLRRRRSAQRRRRRSSRRGSTRRTPI